MFTRRSFLASLSSSVVIIGSPAIVPITSLMRVRGIPMLEPSPQIGLVQRVYLYPRARTIADLQQLGSTPAQIASELNRRDLRLVNSERWTASQVTTFVEATQKLRLNPPLWPSKGGA